MSTHPFDHIKMKTAPAYMQSEVQDYNLKKARAGDSQGFGFLYAFTHTKKCRGLARGRFSLCIYIQGEVGLRGALGRRSSPRCFLRSLVRRGAKNATFLRMPRNKRLARYIS